MYNYSYRSANNVNPIQMQIFCTIMMTISIQYSKKGCIIISLVFFFKLWFTITLFFVPPIANHFPTVPSYQQRQPPSLKVIPIFVLRVRATFFVETYFLTTNLIPSLCFFLFMWEILHQGSVIILYFRCQQQFKGFPQKSYVLQQSKDKQLNWTYTVDDYTLHGWICLA